MIDHTQLQIQDAFYFVIVTVSGVGYGDITPQSPFTRLFVTIVILIALVIIPVHVSRLVKLSKQRAVDWYRPPKGDKILTQELDHLAMIHTLPCRLGYSFVIVAGHHTLTKAMSFLDEFFSDKTEHTSVTQQVVFVSAEPFPENMNEALSRAKHYKKCVLLRGLFLLVSPFSFLCFFSASHAFQLQGSLLSPYNLASMSAGEADSIFIFADQFSATPDAEDASCARILLETHLFFFFLFFLRLLTHLTRKRKHSCCLERQSGKFRLFSDS